MVRELVLWKSGVPIFQPSGGKGREQISAKVMSSSWTKNESSYSLHPLVILYPVHVVIVLVFEELHGSSQASAEFVEVMLIQQIRGQEVQLVVGYELQDLLVLHRQQVMDALAAIPVFAA